MPRQSATTRRTAPRKASATKPPARAKKAEPARPASPAAATAPAAPAGAPSTGACPRCGATSFAPEQRIRVDGNRTVRYTILVCERGHTFAKPSVPR